MVEWVLAILRVAKAIPGLSSWAEPLIERRQLARVARDIAALTFWTSGWITPLRRIAAGQGTESDLHQITTRLRETKSEVTGIAPRLLRARDALVANKFGKRTARALDELVHSKIAYYSDVEEEGLRRRLEEFVLVQMNSKFEIYSAYTRYLPKPSGNSLSDPGRAAIDAERLLKEIEEFNREIEALHEVIRTELQPTRSPLKRSVRRARGQQQ